MTYLFHYIPFYFSLTLDSCPNISNENAPPHIECHSYIYPKTLVMHSAHTEIKEQLLTIMFFIEKFCEKKKQTIFLVVFL